jgi:glycerol-3-phosphate dehydrogenase
LSKLVNLYPEVLAAFTVPGDTFDSLRLALYFAATAKSNGAKFRLLKKVTEFTFDGHDNVTGVKLWDRNNDKRSELHGDIVVNAAGAWAGQIAEMPGDPGIPIHPTPGMMVAYISV